MCYKYSFRAKGNNKAAQKRGLGTSRALQGRWWKQLTGGLLIARPLRHFFQQQRQAVGERSPAQEAQGTSFLSEPHLAQPSGFVIPPNPRVTEGRKRRRSQIRGRKRISSAKGHEAVLCSAPAFPAQASASANPFQSDSQGRQELIYFVGREGRGRGGGRTALQQSADEWSLCARCCSAVTTSTFSGGRKRASSTPPIRPTPAPFVRCLLSGPPARTRRAAPQIAPDLGHLIRPKRRSPGADTAPRAPGVAVFVPGCLGAGHAGASVSPLQRVPGSSQTTLHMPNYFRSPKRVKISSPPVLHTEMQKP